MSWTNREKYCENIANRANALIWIYEETTIYYERVNTALSITLVVGSYLFGSSGIPAILLGDWEYAKYISLILNILMISVGALGTAIKIFGFDKRIKDYNTILVKYTDLFVEVKKELSKPVPDRIAPDVFYFKIIDKETNLRQTSLHIPCFVVRKYRNLFNNHIKYEDLFIGPMFIETEDSSDESVDLENIVNKSFAKKSQDFFNELLRRI